MEQAPSSSASPFFNGNDHAYWKVRIKAHSKSLHDNVLIICEKGWTKSNGGNETW
jgi:hypothetical protein